MSEDVTIRESVPDYDEKTLRELVLAYRRGEIFTSMQVTPANVLPMVFLPLSFLSTEQLQEFREANVGMLWEYRRDALPSGINGMPIFASVRTMSKPNFDRFLALFDEIQKMEDEFAAGEGK